MAVTNHKALFEIPASSYGFSDKSLQNIYYIATDCRLLFMMISKPHKTKMAIWLMDVHVLSFVHVMENYLFFHSCAGSYRLSWHILINFDCLYIMLMEYVNCTCSIPLWFWPPQSIFYNFLCLSSDVDCTRLVLSKYRT